LQDVLNNCEEKYFRNLSFASKEPVTLINKGGETMEVKVYSTPTCPYCTMAKKYLDSKNVKYEEYDVSQDRNAATQMIEKSGQRGVPVLEIDGNIVIGFDKERIDGLIG
jgi:glutaredoxin 3